MHSSGTKKFKLTACCSSCKQEIDYTERFWSRVNKIGHPNGCWLWTSHTRPNGYGQLLVGGKQLSVHRIAYQFANGPISEPKLYVCHTCDNKNCVNPEHLYLGTSSENSYDRIVRGRIRKGETHPGAKLNEQQVLDIRKRGVIGSYKNLAVEFSVTPELIAAIIRRKIWRHLP